MKVWLVGSEIDHVEYLEGIFDSEEKAKTKKELLEETYTRDYDYTPFHVFYYGVDVE